MDKREKQPKKRWRPLPLRGTRLGPVLQALLTLLLLGGGLYAFVRFGWPVLKDLPDHPADLSCLGFGTPVPSPSPAPTPVPSPTPVPGTERTIYGVDLSRVQHEILIPEYQYAGDFTVWGDTILFVVGNYTADGTAAFTRAILYDTEARHATYQKLDLSYKSIRHPQMNDKWIVYLDALSSGGGQLRAYDRRTGEDRILKTVHLGLPALALWEDTVFWIERTGTSRDKLFGCDLNTGESVTLEIFENTDAGVSAVSAGGGKLVYVTGSGAMKTMDLVTGESRVDHFGSTVHDPKTDGRITAFLTGFHGEDSALVYVDERGQLVTAAQGVAALRAREGACAALDAASEKTKTTAPAAAATPSAAHAKRALPRARPRRSSVDVTDIARPSPSGRPRRRNPTSRGSGARSPRRRGRCRRRARSRRP